MQLGLFLVTDRSMKHFVCPAFWELVNWWNMFPRGKLCYNGGLAAIHWFTHRWTERLKVSVEALEDCITLHFICLVGTVATALHQHCTIFKATLCRIWKCQTLAKATNRLHQFLQTTSEPLETLERCYKCSTHSGFEQLLPWQSNRAEHVHWLLCICIFY